MTPPFILCHPTGKAEPTPDDDWWVLSPLECLYRAAVRPPAIIVIRFPAVPLWKREILILLCAALKSCSQTKAVPLLALLPTRHRTLLEDLRRVGVEFVKYVRKLPLDRRRIVDLILGLGQDDRVEHQLTSLCPYTHYAIIDRDREVTVCGGYLDRMVLGGRRLRELCRTENHLQCDYFLNPRDARGAANRELTELTGPSPVRQSS